MTWSGSTSVRTLEWTSVPRNTFSRICAVVTDTANQLARRSRRKRLLLALRIELDPNVTVQLFVVFARTLLSLRVWGNSGIQLRVCGTPEFLKASGITSIARGNEGHRATIQLPVMIDIKTGYRLAYKTSSSHGGCVLSICFVLSLVPRPFYKTENRPVSGTRLFSF